MTIRALWVFVAMMCCLLAFATFASAECAWMLWAQTQTASGESTNPVSASETKQTCERSLRTILDSMKPNANAVVRENTSEVLVPGTITRYICLPDTIDPRGSMGK